MDDVRSKLRLHAAFVPQAVVVDLISALVISQAASELAGPGGGNFVTRLFQLQQELRSRDFRLETFSPLIDVIVDDAALDLIRDIKLPLTFPLSTLPPFSLRPTFRGTPVKKNSSQLDDSETREVVERELLEEIRHCTFRNVADFFDRVFDLKSWSKDRAAMYEQMMKMHDGKRWTGFPPTPDENRSRTGLSL